MTTNELPRNPRMLAKARQFAPLGRNWALYPLSVPTQLDTPKQEYDTLFKASGLKFVDLLKRQG